MEINSQIIQNNLPQTETIIEVIENTDIESVPHELNVTGNSNLKNRDTEVDNPLIENYSNQDGNEIQEFIASEQDDSNLAANNNFQIDSPPRSSRVSNASSTSPLSSFSSESNISRVSNISHDNCRVSLN